MKPRSLAAPDIAENVDLRGLPPAAMALIVQLANELRVIEARARCAEEAAQTAEQHRENAIREVRNVEAAAVASLAEERRRHADQISAIRVAHDALTAALGSAIDMSGTDTMNAIALSTGRQPHAVNSAADPELVVDDVAEDLCAAMIAAGEAQDRAEALAILVREAVALRRSATAAERMLGGATTSPS